MRYLTDKVNSIGNTVARNLKEFSTIYLGKSKMTIIKKKCDVSAMFPVSFITHISTL